VRWVLSAFDKRTELISGETPLPGIDAPALRQLFSRPEDDPMVLNYPVTPAVAARLMELLPGRLSIDLDRYDYFVEPDGG
jgi:hypothetical protein